jgi:ligand-binding sensor domain-containing protein
LVINVGSTDTIKATISPANATNADIKWTSDDSTIVKVSSNGVITGVAPGSVTITAATADGNKTAACAVTSAKWTLSVAGMFSNQVNCLAADAQGNIWTGGRTLSKYDGTDWSYFLADKGVSVIAVDVHGNKWFGTFGNGVYMFDGTNWTNYTSENSGLTDDWIVANGIAADSQGNVWFGTSNSSNGTGVSKFDGTNWTTYTSKDGLAYNLVSSIAIDAQGNKWFVTGKGISKFDGITWTSYTSANTNNELVDRAYSVVADALGNKWFGTGSGVLKFDGTNWTSYTISNSGLVYDEIRSIAIDAKGNKWFGTLLGISKFDGTKWTTYKQYLDLGCFVKSIAFDPQGNKWFGTSIGLLKLED